MVQERVGLRSQKALPRTDGAVQLVQLVREDDGSWGVLCTTEEFINAWPNNYRPVFFPRPDYRWHPLVGKYLWVCSFFYHRNGGLPS